MKIMTVEELEAIVEKMDAETEDDQEDVLYDMYVQAWPSKEAQDQ